MSKVCNTMMFTPLVGRLATTLFAKRTSFPGLNGNTVDSNEKISDAMPLAMGKEALALVGKIHVAPDVHGMIEEGRRDYRA
ncbi:MAG: hypothetical protein WC600_12335 [Desulfobaccales bacterium]